MTIIVMVPTREKTEATRSAVSIPRIWLGVKPSGSMLANETNRLENQTVENELEVFVGF